MKNKIEFLIVAAFCIIGLILGVSAIYVGCNGITANEAALEHLETTNDYTDWNADSILVMQHGKYVNICVKGIQRTSISELIYELDDRIDWPEETIVPGCIVQVRYSEINDSLYVRFNNFMVKDTNGWTTLLVTD